MSTFAFNFQAEALHVADIIMQQDLANKSLHESVGESYLKGIAKIIPSQFCQPFTSELSNLLNARGVQLVAVRRIWGKENQDLKQSLLFDFIKGLESYWEPRFKKRIYRIVEDIHLVDDLGYDEVTRLLNECILETSKYFKMPILVLYDVNSIPYLINSLFFIRFLEDTVMSCDFLWCIVSSSDLFHKFNGRFLADKEELFQVRRKDNITEDTDLPIPPISFFNKKGRKLGRFDILTLGNTPDCAVRLGPTNNKRFLDTQLELAMVRGVRGMASCGFFSFSSIGLSMKYITSIEVPLRESEVFFDWAEIGLEMGLNSQMGLYRNSGEPATFVKVYDLIASRSNTVNTYLTIPALSFIRLKISLDKLNGYFVIFTRNWSTD